MLKYLTEEVDIYLHVLKGSLPSINLGVDTLVGQDLFYS